jgi:hypothetical protein
VRSGANPTRSTNFRQYFLRLAWRLILPGSAKTTVLRRADLTSDNLPNAIRFGTEMGGSKLGKLLVVVHTERGDNIGIISARPASKNEGHL